MLKWSDIESRAVAYAKAWKNCEGKEKQQAQTFEKDLMHVFGIDWHEGMHEYPVTDIEGRTGYIDYLLPGKILIEMKSKGESLIRAYNQGYDYCKCLSDDEYPELLLVSDFDYIQVTNLRTMQTFKKFKLSQLKNHVRMLGTLAGYNSEVTFKTDVEVNIDASYKMAKLHDGLKENGYEGKQLEIYLVRLLFCLFAEDTGIFEKGAFQNYIKESKEDGSDLSARIMMLFAILDMPTENRMHNLSDDLKKFRYINGKLFSEVLPPASFDSKMRNILIDCSEFDWSYISPAIFGAMFQGVMNPKERREMGAHYTSEENILKLIKPLFLNDLWSEFERCKSIKTDLETFHNKLASLVFLDPACGCGNFLIITYRELRLLEFEVLKILYDNSDAYFINTICKVHINQFYGIEYEEFPCQIAGVGLLLMKHQMDKEVSNYFGMNFIDFPIKETGNIVHGNALRVDWEDVVPKSKLSYIIGNPPFVGQGKRNTEQSQDMKYIFKEQGNKLDYVAAWFVKAAELMKDTNIRTAFVSVNSISQGESVPLLWKNMFDKGIKINFAYSTFKWSNEARENAAVMCVIIGFSWVEIAKKRILYTSKGEAKLVNHINGYLKDAPDVFIENRSKAINSGRGKVTQGSPQADDGMLSMSREEYEKFITKYPDTKELFRPFVGSKEFINDVGGYSRYCLWLKDVPVQKYRHNIEIMNRLEHISKFRRASSVDRIRKTADLPYLFTQIRQPDTEYLMIPRHSSQKRRYIPIGFLSSDIIASEASVVVNNATIYDFGIISSNVHMAWMRAVCGRIKSDYRYSPSVYYNFPFPNPTAEQKNRIELAAQLVLQERKSYKGYCLADLYDPLSMPPGLLKAHRNLDKEVCKAYGVIWKEEEDCVSDLMKMYQDLVEKQ